jgi:hypothetical protein
MPITNTGVWLSSLVSAEIRQQRGLRWRVERNCKWLGLNRRWLVALPVPIPGKLIKLPSDTWSDLATDNEKLCACIVKELATALNRIDPSATQPSGFKDRSAGESKDTPG